MFNPKRILNRQTDKFISCGLRKFLERYHHESEIFRTKKYYYIRSILRKNIGEQTLKDIYRRTVKSPPLEIRLKTYNINSLIIKAEYHVQDCDRELSGFS